MKATHNFTYVCEDDDHKLVFLLYNYTMINDAEVSNNEGVILHDVKHMLASFLFMSSRFDDAADVLLSECLHVLNYFK